MTQLSSVLTFARGRAGVDTNSLTDALGVDFANFVTFKTRKMLIDHGIDVAKVVETKISVVDGTQTYSFPTDMFYVPKEMEINWFESPVTDEKYVPLNKVDESNLQQGVSMGWLRKHGDVFQPVVDYRGDNFEILPTPNAQTWSGTAGSTLSNAIRLFYYQQPVAYVTTTATVTNPEGLDIYSFGELIKDVYHNSIKILSDADLEAKFESVVGKLISMTQGDGMSPTTAKSIGWTGFEF